MKCRKPFYGIHGCGQCLPCRINKRRLLTTQIILESLTHKENSFITLTYENNLITLRPADTKLFVRRLRYVYPNTRYFLVGEYGDRSERPHYHACLFGLIPSKSFLETTWSHGLCHIGDLNSQSASYAAGYVTKKLTNINDLHVRTWLAGRHAEFSRRSSRPVLGYNAIRQMADKTSEIVFDQQGIRMGSHFFPLGRTLKRKLKELTLNPDTIHAMQMQRQEENFLKDQTSYENFSHPTLSWSSFQKEVQKQLLLNDEYKLRLKPKKDRSL